MNNNEIRRRLGIGTSTLSARLREYKDPFEINDSAKSIEQKNHDKSTQCIHKASIKGAFTIPNHE